MRWLRGTFGRLRQPLVHLMYQITSYLIGTNAYSREPLNLWVIGPSTRRVAQALDYSHIVLVPIWKHANHTLAPRHFWAFTPTSSAFDVSDYIVPHRYQRVFTRTSQPLGWALYAPGGPII
jgi:hypothetical protein